MYERKLKLIDKSSADHHFLLGLWARRRRLLREATYHLNYAIAIDPDHPGSRRVMGQVKYKGKWMPEAEAKKAQGLRFYKGRWMTEEAAVAEEAADLKRILTEQIGRRIRAFASIIDKPKNDSARRRATDALIHFRDTLGHPALVKLLRHRSPAVREVAIRAVDKLGIEGVDREIFTHALYDVDGYVRARARGVLKRHWEGGMLVDTLNALRKPKEPGARFNSALILGVIKDISSVDALIRAIYVTQKKKDSNDWEEPSMLRGFIIRKRDKLNTGGPIISDPVAGVVGAGPGSRWRPIDAPADPRYTYLINYAALDALRAITQNDFGVNKKAWRKWWDENRDDFHVFNGKPRKD